jgi:hypothetical protein
MSKLLTYFFFFQCLNLGFSQNEASKSKAIPVPIIMNYYDAMSPFEGDYAHVHKPQKGSCLINKQGKEVTGYFASLLPPKNGLMKVKYKEYFKDNEYSIVDMSGKKVIPLCNYYCEIYDDYIIDFDSWDKIYKLFDLEGRLILTYDKPIIPVRKNLLLVSKDSTHQLIDEEGKIMVQTVAKDFRKLNSKYFAFKKGDFWRIMNDKFEEVSGFQYGGISALPNALIWVSRDNKIGALDSNLREIIPLGLYQKIGYSSISRAC